MGRKDAEGEENEETERGYLKYRFQYQIKPIYEEYIKDGIIKSDGRSEMNKIINETPDFKFLKC